MTEDKKSRGSAGDPSARSDSPSASGGSPAASAGSPAASAGGSSAGGGSTPVSAGGPPAGSGSPDVRSGSPAHAPRTQTETGALPGVRSDSDVSVKRPGTDASAARPGSDISAARLGTTVLAYMGDAVWEAYIRRHVISSGLARPDRLHSATVKYVRAQAQAQALRVMIREGFLTGPEEALARRARNHRVSSKPKNADIIDYKTATAFEALTGFLYLSGDEERLMEIMTRAVEITDGRQAAPASGARGKV